MANIKDDFLAQILADLPAGIRDKLDAIIPDPPAAAMPTDTDTAILVNGICAWYVLELFRPLAGLTLIQIPMWLGHLSTVNHNLLLSSLEYNEDTDAQIELEIVNPPDGKMYQPGEVHIQARAKNGTLTQCAVEIGEMTPFTLDDSDGVFDGYVTLDDLGDYTITVTGLFSNEETATAAVTITITDDEDDDPPEDEDIEAVERAKAAVDSAYKKLITLIAQTSDRDALAAAYQQWKKAIQKFVSVGESALLLPNALNQDKAYLEMGYPAVATAIQTYSEGTGTAEELALACGALQSVIEHMLSIIKGQLS